MCRSYGKYVRACYATGKHRGEHVPIAQAVWGRGEHMVFGWTGTKRSRADDSRTCIRCGQPPPAEHVCAECSLERRYR